jgi:hypothetical protein
MLIIFSLIFIPLSIYFGVVVVYTGMDAINTRSLECQNVIVENTSSFNDGYGITFFVNEHVILDTADENNIKKWGRIEPGDTVYMKLGKQTAVFC